MIVAERIGFSGPLPRRGLADHAVLPYFGRVGNSQESLGERITRLVGGRPVAAIARRVGISNNQLSSIMKGGVAQPRIETLDRLADVLQTTRDYLLYGIESDEEIILTWEDLVKWERKIQEQRLRHIERIAAAMQQPAVREPIEYEEAAVEAFEALSRPADERARLLEQQDTTPEADPEPQAGRARPKRSRSES